MPTLECAGQPSAPSSAVEGIQMKTILPIAGILRLAALVLVLLSGSVFGPGA
jgi:hypothetical protein